MVVLVLATSGPAAEVGLELPDGRLEAEVLGGGAARGRDLVAAVERLLASSGLHAADLDGLVVDLGPGSFTGVRVGVTAAKTLAWALSRPAVGVSSLAALARAAPAGREVLAVRDAGRGTLYYAGYGPATGGGRRLHHPAGRAPATHVLSLGADSLLVGEEAPEIAERHASGREALRVTATAAAVLAEARADLVRGPTGSPHALAPLYLQASAPERRRDGESASPPAAGSRTDRS